MTAAAALRLRSSRAARQLLENVHHLVDLTNLTSLQLFANQLTGNIPPELGNLTNLTTLDLSSNQPQHTEGLEVTR